MSASCLARPCAHAAHQPAPSVLLSHAWFLPWSCPGAEVGTPSTGQDQLAALTTGTAFAQFPLSANASSNEGGRSFPSVFFPKVKWKLCQDDNYLFSCRLKVSLKHFGISLMPKHVEHPNWNRASLCQTLQRWLWVHRAGLPGTFKGWSRHVSPWAAASTLCSSSQRLGLSSAPGARNHRLG